MLVLLFHIRTVIYYICNYIFKYYMRM